MICCNCPTALNIWKERKGVNVYRRAIFVLPRLSLGSVSINMPKISKYVHGLIAMAILANWPRTDRRTHKVIIGHASKVSLNRLTFLWVFQNFPVSESQQPENCVTKNRTPFRRVIILRNLAKYGSMKLV